jgi:TonB dependent receptor
VYGGLLPAIDATQYESLRFVQALARLDRGSDSFDGRIYGLNVAGETQGAATGIVSNSTASERGAGFTWHHQSSRNIYGVSLDESTGDADSDDRYAYPVAPGSSLSTLRARATAALHPTPLDEIDLSGEAGNVQERAAPAGTRFASYSWTPSAARVGYAHAVLHNLSLRAAAGTSTVTPPLDVLSGGPAVLQNYIGFPARFVSFSSDVSQIERAAGGDVGLEWRMHGATTTLSADWYQNATHGAYVLESEPLSPSAMLERWFNGPSMLDQGVQVSLVQFKPVGLGFIAQVAFPRTYVFGALPPGFYAHGNLAIVPGQNVGGGAFFVAGENDVSPFRIPYAQGYAEISYKWPRGSRLSLGMLYVGANNPYAQPAFTTFNSNLELSLGPKAKLQFSVENLFNALDNRLPLAFQGIGVPLANGFAGLTNANALQPRTIRFMMRQSIGSSSIYEH